MKKYIVRYGSSYHLTLWYIEATNKEEAYKKFVIASGYSYIAWQLEKLDDYIDEIQGESMEIIDHDCPEPDYED